MENQMTTENARRNMITQQLRTCNILDEHILNIIRASKRESFVPEAFRHLAFADVQIPLPHEETMMTPLQEGALLQNLAIEPQDKILEIGTGTGYLTSLLAKLGEHVFSVDIYPDFISTAQTQLNKYKITNVTLNQADAATGWEQEQPYDIICITGSLPFLPERFKNSMAIGGRLFAVLGQSPAMHATIVSRLSENDWQAKQLFETDLKALLNAEQKDPFIF